MGSAYGHAQQKFETKISYNILRFDLLVPLPSPKLFVAAPQIFCICVGFCPDVTIDSVGGISIKYPGSSALVSEFPQSVILAGTW